jgi:hypothetical protein
VLEKIRIFRFVFCVLTPPNHMFHFLFAKNKSNNICHIEDLKLCSYNNLRFFCFRQKYIFPIDIYCMADHSLALCPVLQIAVQRITQLLLPTDNLRHGRCIRNATLTMYFCLAPFALPLVSTYPTQLSYELEHINYRPSKASCWVHES